MKRGRVVGGVAAVALVVTAAFAAPKLLDSPISDGPLDGPGFVQIETPVRPGEADVMWGIAVLTNASSRPVILQRVEIRPTVMHERLFKSATIVGPERVGITGLGSVAITRWPLPAPWEQVKQYAVPGYVVAPDAEEIDSNGDVAGSEILIRLRVPGTDSLVSGIRVFYKVDGAEYVEDFPASLLLCHRASSGQEGCAPVQATSVH